MQSWRQMRWDGRGRKTAARSRKKAGQGILGVVDGFSPQRVEDETEIKWRKDFLRQIGYKQ